MRIVNKIDTEKIYDKNLNFLIGAGASNGLFPTLSIKLDNNSYTFETLLEKAIKEPVKIRKKLTTLTLMAYYRQLILPVQQCNYIYPTNSDGGKVINNYRQFIENIIHILSRSDKKICNIFTTNYDGCIPFSADHILREGAMEFAINDGTHGFFKKQLEARNYNQTHHRTGMFSEYKEQLPTLNFIPLHGSAYWSLENDNIFVNYTSNNQDINIPDEIEEFCELLNDKNKKYDDLVHYADYADDFDLFGWLTDEIMKDFIQKYKNIPIVNPTKRKFYETVLEEHFYQMLRLMSYEFEKKQTVFIVFGFSFADEHILQLIKRSLSNPNLQLYVCCYDKDNLDTMKGYFSNYKNVSLVQAKDDDKKSIELDFTTFNDSVFTLKKLMKQSSKNIYDDWEI